MLLFDLCLKMMKKIMCGGTAVNDPAEYLLNADRMTLVLNKKDIVTKVEM